MHPNTLEIVRNAYEQWNEKRGASFAPFMNILHDNIEWTSLAGGAAGMEFTAPRSGRGAVADYFRALTNDWQMDHYTPELFVVEGDWIVMLGACGWTNKRTGIKLETAKADFIRIEDGKIREFRELYDTAKALAATRSDAPREKRQANKAKKKAKTKVAAKSKAKPKSAAKAAARPRGAKPAARRKTRKTAARRR